MILQKLLILIQTNFSKRTNRTKLRKAIFPSSHKSNSILILVDDNQQFNKSLLSKYSFFQNSKVIYFSTTNSNSSDGSIIGKQELNFLGIPKKTILKPEIIGPIDVILNLSNGKNQAIEYICAVSLAKFKIAGQQNNDTYDLIIKQAETNIQQFLEEVVNAIENLKSDSIL